MTPREIVNANRAIAELSGVVLPYKAARAIAILKKRLREEFDVVLGQENAIAEKYNGKRTAAIVNFESDEIAEAFTEEYESFMTEDTGVKFSPVDLSKYADMLRLSPSAIEALDGIVIFEKEGSNG